ncbi:alternative oxidase [Methylocystis hirsuta]|uniref:Alternative oxidase n=1 Tax=Methylocystis hirsuta TaxID=369798 RepID=A0A3M9XU37_9HYPH|nr:alternative oxidase [Methylocystis hirsuta]RNJ51365.1 hypothetical protein D1O30_18970 [Methylocystis hirsuta]
MEYDEQHLEALAVSLNDPKVREEYKAPYDGHKCSFVPRFLGGFIVMAGNIVFGDTPSYLKFRAVEVIARVPYHSWDSAAFTILTTCYSNAAKALELGHTSRFARMAQDNETMHVVVISELSAQEEQANVIIHTVIPMLFAFFYYWMSYVLYLLKPRYSMELNYLFESHAFEQYSLFLEQREHDLKRKPVDSEYLRWYGRHAKSHYELFELIRNDELIHRNRSIREIEEGHLR